MSKHKVKEEPVEENVENEESTNETDEEDEDGTEEQSSPTPFNSLMRRQFLQEMVRNLPVKLKNRIIALKNNQLNLLKMETKFYEEVYRLEKKYQDMYQPFFDKRRDIIIGKFEPTDEQPQWKEDESEQLPPPSEDQKLPGMDELIEQFKNIPADVVGVPNFWLTIFRNVEMLSDLVQEHDEPLLKKLNDIKIRYDDEHSYVLEFHFDKNEYFTNESLTKKYFLRSILDEDNPFLFEGHEIYKSKGCNINWERKMNLTVKTIRKKQKHKRGGAKRTIIKQVPNESFFNFFAPPEIPTDNKTEIDEETQQQIQQDFEVGHFFRARIIPKAVLYFTGDIADEDDTDDDDDESGSDDDDDDDDDEDEEEEEEDHRVNTSNSKALRGPPPECQTQ